MWCVDWSDDARAFYKANKGSNLLGPAYWYREGITYTDITSSMFNARYMPEGCLYDKSGPAFHPVEGDLHYILALINTKPVDYILKILNPSFHCQVRDVKNIPRIDMRTEEVSANGKELVAIAKADWDANETSHGFAGLWSLGSDPGASLADAWGRWEREAKASAEASNRLEERNNQIFIEAYGLGHTLDEAVSEAQTYLAKPDRQKDAQRFVSYAIGCMMGRYSLDAPGLAYAGSDGVGFDPDLYARFAASADGIVPMTYEAWFDEDAALRITDFVAAVWGAEGKAANMAWLAESLGAKTSESSEEALRRYLADKLYKDHIQVYKKRPIYWHFSSGKLGAFQALVYMHRYNGSTLPRMRSEYVVPLLGRMAARLDMLELDSHASSSPASRTKIQKQIEALRRKHSELMAFDERLRHYADMRITIDMADGTQRNYAKFGDLVSDVKTIVGDSDE